MPPTRRRFNCYAEAGLVYEVFLHLAAKLRGLKCPARRAGAYSGTCRGLTEAQRKERGVQRPPALRLRAEQTSYTVQDDFYGAYTGLVDDFVLVRTTAPTPIT